VILPARNKKDMVDVPKQAKKGMTFFHVKNISEALRIAMN
jgi:ATP-dependent Lon protease